MAVTDYFGREIDYLRFSVTDRCNFRCLYCNPLGGAGKLTHADILTYEEAERLLGHFSSLGIVKLRLTGGEPLVRKGLTDFIARINARGLFREISLTTNGLLLEDYAEKIFSAGIRRINISLDSIRPERFSQITGGGDLGRVLRGMNKAKAAGLGIKMNTVIMKGLNDDEIIDIINFGHENSISVRFIEYMPFLMNEDYRKKFMSMAEILERVGESIRRMPDDDGKKEVARYFLAGQNGMVGVIPSISHPFCDKCNRIRLLSSGRLRLCLYDDYEINLKQLLNNSGDDNKIAAVIREFIVNKPYSFNPGAGGYGGKRRMSEIGG